jgi:hypothetical protein
MKFAAVGDVKISPFFRNARAGEAERRRRRQRNFGQVLPRTRGITSAGWLRMLCGCFPSPFSCSFTRTQHPNKLLVMQKLLLIQFVTAAGIVASVRGSVKKIGASISHANF